MAGGRGHDAWMSPHDVDIGDDGDSTAQRSRIPSKSSHTASCIVAERSSQRAPSKGSQHGARPMGETMSFGRGLRRAGSFSGAVSIASGWSGDSDRQPQRKTEKQHMFVDAEEMKRRVRENLSKEVYDVAMYYHPTGLWRTVATHPRFEKLTLAVIAVNAMWIGVDTDHNKSDTLLQAKPGFQIVEQLFCLFFSFEWFARFMSFKRKRSGLKDKWFVFDTALVFMMVAETWILTAMMLVMGGAGASGMSNASILRMARLARLSRMARMARLLRAMPELMILVKGIVAATRSVFFTLALLCLLMYIFAIAFTQLTVGTKVGKEYFAKVGGSMFTLLVYGTLMDGITSPLSKLGKEHLLLGALFLLFVLLAALTLMNMLIGVLTEVVSAVAATEKEELLVTFVRNKMERVLKSIDADGDGTISKNEFVKILESKEATEALQEVDVDVVNLVDFADFIFADDENAARNDKHLEFKDFMEVVLQFRGSNHATVKDIVNLRKFVGNALNQQRSELRDIKEKLLKRIHATGAGQRSMARQQTALKVQLQDARGGPPRHPALPAAVCAALPADFTPPPPAEPSPPELRALGAAHAAPRPPDALPPPLPLAMAELSREELARLALAAPPPEALPKVAWARRPSPAA